MTRHYARFRRHPAPVQAEPIDRRRELLRWRAEQDAPSVLKVLAGGLLFALALLCEDALFRALWLLAATR